MEDKKKKRKKSRKSKKIAKEETEKTAPEESQSSSQTFQKIPKPLVAKKSTPIIQKEPPELPMIVPNYLDNEIKTFLDQKAPGNEGQWTDDLFPPNEKSLIGNNTSNDIDINEIEWKRPTQIFPEPHVFEGQLNTRKIINGRIGIPYFISSISALCDIPGLITKIFMSKDYNPDGYYSLTLFIDGEYKIVHIDDNFPCLKGTNLPYFTKPNNFGMWSMLLEKAWAKINGNYDNCLSGWPCDIFRAFTGFCCEVLQHDDEDSERVFNIIKKAKEKNAVICSSTRSDEEINDVGLIGGTSYTLLGVEEVEDDKNRKVCLIKMRNDLGNSDWNGDWNEKSLYWNDHIKKQIPNERLELKEGEFFISLKDFLKYFSRTDICHIIYEGVTKTYIIEKTEDIEYPHIFNFKVSQKGNVSIGIIEKNWRYHRELQNVSHPTSIILAGYEPGNTQLKYITGAYECYDDVEKTRELEPGYYFLYVYKVLKISEKPLPEAMNVRIISEGDISMDYIGADVDFDVAEQIIYYGVKLLKEDKISDDAIFYDISSDFKGSGLGYRLIINPLKDVYQKWEIDTSSNGGYYLLSKFENPNIFNFTVNPNDFETILFMRDREYGVFKLNIKHEVEQENCDEDKIRLQKRREFKTYCTDLEFGEKIEGEKTPSLEELSKFNPYPEIDNDIIFIEDNKTDENKQVNLDEILNLEKPENKEKLSLVRIENDEGVYIGEANYATPQGRGCYMYKKDGESWIGYFDNGAKGKYGKYYDKDGKLLYEGDYKRGERNGKGKCYYPDGSKYEGDFVKNKKEGSGVFHWDDKTRWEGTWKNDKMDGTGTYYEGENSTPLTYKDGNAVNN